jgi:hypothetical protein
LAFLERSALDADAAVGEQRRVWVRGGVVEHVTEGYYGDTMIRVDSVASGKDEREGVDEFRECRWCIGKEGGCRGVELFDTILQRQQ